MSIVAYDQSVDPLLAQYPPVMDSPYSIVIPPYPQTSQRVEYKEETFRTHPPLETSKTQSLPKDLHKIAQQLIDDKFGFVKKKKIPHTQSHVADPILAARFEPHPNFYSPLAAGQRYEMTLIVPAGVSLDEIRYHIHSEKLKLQHDWGIPVSVLCEWRLYPS